MPKQAKILIVDDDKIFVDAMKIVLESKNYQVSAAYNGDEGLAKARSEKPSLIILDVIMPNKDGFKVCEEIKGDPRLAKTPVLMLTSFAQRKAGTSIPASGGMALEAEDYVDKPVSPEELLKRVQKLLKK